MELIPVKQCPLVSDYQFKSHCRITTCKYYSPSTKNHCMSMDVKFSSDDNTISDAELLHYKFPDKEITTKDVARIRKTSVERLQNWLMLHTVIATILENYDESTGLVYVAGRSKLVDRILSEKPLCCPEFGFMPWMLTLLTDEDYPKSIVASFDFKATLGLSQKEYGTFCKDIQVMRSGDSLFETII